MSAYRNAGKIRGAKKVNTATAFTYTDYLDVMGEALRRIASRTPGGIKGVASAANCNERTLENIAQKRNGPNGFTLWQLQLLVPGFETEAKRLAGCENSPEFQRDLADLVTRHVRINALKGEQ